MVRIGIIGIGFMGKTHWEAAQTVSGGKATAICTRSETKLAGDWSGIQGNFGGRGGNVDLSNIKKYRDYRDMLADPDIDLVDICLPTALHKGVAIAAFQAGKHVLLEKPIAVELADADEMTQAAEASGKKFLVGQVLRFWPQFAYLKEAVESGKHGKLIGGNFKRIISAPDWSDSWLEGLDKSGGPGIDLHIHDADFLNYLIGMPDAVFSTGILARGRYAQYVSTQYLYEERGLSISCQSGAIAKRGRPFEHGYELYFEDATVAHNSSWDPPVVKVITDEGAEQISPPETDGFAQEIQYAIDCVVNDAEPTLLSGRSARDSLALCWKEIESIQTGRLLRL